ncbi:MAG: hypothetical protein IPP96_11085 [Chitinophagaceae bacterium]|nr:hypothetical protein [Chitinophagaceae bacterium]
MKKIITVALIILLPGWGVNAQINANKQPVVKTDLISPVNLFENGKYNNAPVNDEPVNYLQKSRNQKIAGWCFVGAGAVGLAIGLASFPKGDLLFPSDEDASKADRATTITIIGSALLIGSTPFFILSNVNKRKARLSVSSNKTGFGVPSKVNKNITGITMSIPIGK